MMLHRLLRATKSAPQIVVPAVTTLAGSGTLTGNVLSNSDPSVWDCYVHTHLIPKDGNWYSWAAEVTGLSANNTSGVKSGTSGSNSWCTANLKSNTAMTARARWDSGGWDVQTLDGGVWSVGSLDASNSVQDSYPFFRVYNNNSITFGSGGSDIDLFSLYTT